MVTDKLRTLAFGTKPQILHLQHADHGVIVVGLQQIDLFMPDSGSGKQSIAIQGPPTAKLDGVVGKGIMTLTARQHPDRLEPKISGPMLGHHQEAFRSGARHHTVKQMNGFRDRPRIQVLLERQGHAKQGGRKALCVLALGDAQFSKVLTLRAVLPHVVGREQCKTRIRAAGPVWPDGVLRKAAESSERVSKAGTRVCIGADAGNNLCILRFNGPYGSPEGDDSRRPTHRYVVQPPQGQTQMLSEANCRIGSERETREAQAIDGGLLEVGSPEHFRQRPRCKPMSRILAEAGIWNGRRGGDDGSHETRFFMDRRSWVPVTPTRCRASSPSRARRIFCVAVSGKWAQKAM